MDTAAGVPIDARIVWLARDRIYVATRDSLRLERGARLGFRVGGDIVASAEVTRVLAPEMALARLTSGALIPLRDLDRVRIEVAPPVMAPAAVLRVGLPSRVRSNLIFACDPAVRTPEGLGYRVETASARVYRLVRGPAAASGAPWPDTLRVRLFDEIADEEIALERGDLDVAVFWPGEPSAHLRAAPRPLLLLAGARSRGVVAAIRTDSGAATDTAVVIPDRALKALDQIVFRGDLERWADGAPAGADVDPRRARFEVDASFPGRAAIESALNGRARAPLGAPAFRLFYLDVPHGVPDSIARGAAGHVRRGVFPPDLRARADSILADTDPAPGSRTARAEPILDRLRDALRVVPVFTISCPIACVSSAEPWVRAIGAGALADLIGCGPARP